MAVLFCISFIAAFLLSVAHIVIGIILIQSGGSEVIFQSSSLIGYALCAMLIFGIFVSDKYKSILMIIFYVCLSVRIIAALIIDLDYNDLVSLKISFWNFTILFILLVLSVVGVLSSVWKLKYLYNKWVLLILELRSELRVTELR